MLSLGAIKCLLFLAEILHRNKKKKMLSSEGI